MRGRRVIRKVWRKNASRTSSCTKTLSTARLERRTTNSSHHRTRRLSSAGLGLDDRIDADPLDHGHVRDDPATALEVLEPDADHHFPPLLEWKRQRQRERRRAQYRTLDRRLHDIHRRRADELRDED